MYVVNINIEEFYQQFCKEYEFLYNNRDRVAGYSEAVSAFDEMIANSENFKAFVGEFCRYRSDVISSDREAAAFMFALDVLA